MANWSDIVDTVRKIASKRKLAAEYLERLEYELKEIDKQGAASYWEDILSEGRKYDTNKNGLVLPWLLGITAIDPIKGCRKMYVTGLDEKVDGVEIVLENGDVIHTSNNTLFKTKRGLIKACDLTNSDEFI